jgi:hypothetical protein
MSRMFPISMAAGNTCPRGTCPSETSITSAGFLTHFHRVVAQNSIAYSTLLQTATGFAFTDEDVVLDVWIAGV